LGYKGANEALRFIKLPAKLFFTGVFLIVASFALYHLTCPRTLTTEQILNPKASCWLLPDFFRITFILGFVICMISIYGLVHKILKNIGHVKG